MKGKQKIWHLCILSLSLSLSAFDKTYQTLQLIIIFYPNLMPGGESFPTKIVK